MIHLTPEKLELSAYVLDPAWIDTELLDHGH